MREPSRRTLLLSADAAVACSTARLPTVGGGDKVNVAGVGLGLRGVYHPMLWGNRHQQPGAVGPRGGRQVPQRFLGCLKPGETIAIHRTASYSLQSGRTPVNRSMESNREGVKISRVDVGNVALSSRIAGEPVTVHSLRGWFLFGTLQSGREAEHLAPGPTTPGTPLLHRSLCRNRLARSSATHC